MMAPRYNAAAPPPAEWFDLVSGEKQDYKKQFELNDLSFNGIVMCCPALGLCYIEP